MTAIGPDRQSVLDAAWLHLRDRTRARWPGPDGPATVITPDLATDLALALDDTGQHYLADLVRGAPTVDGDALALRLAEHAADATVAFTAQAIDPHRTHQAAADQLEADGHHALALSCRMAATYSAAILGEHLDPPGTEIFNWLYDAVYPHVALTGPGVLARRLRDLANRLDDQAHDAAIADAEGQAA